MQCILGDEKHTTQANIGLQHILVNNGQMLHRILNSYISGTLSKMSIYLAVCKLFFLCMFIIFKLSKFPYAMLIICQSWRLINIFKLFKLLKIWKWLGKPAQCIISLCRPFFVLMSAKLFALFVTDVKWNLSYLTLSTKLVIFSMYRTSVALLCKQIR